MKLSNATLQALPDGVKRPDYDRSALTAGIVHIGLGNFHRAHQAWYLHRLDGSGSRGTGLGHHRRWRPRARCGAARTGLLTQDCLNTLIELDPSGMLGRGSQAP